MRRTGEREERSRGPGKSFMSVEFVDTNVLVYAHDGNAGIKHARSVDLLTRLVEGSIGALSIQVLSEFYSVATRKLGMSVKETEDIIDDLSGWLIHRPDHADLIRASRLHRARKIAWWDALVLNSAIQLSCSALWSEDFGSGQRFGKLIVRNPYL